MSVAALQSLIESRWSGAAVHGRVLPITGWPTGIASVDRALGPTGIPCGRLTEVFGERSCGKTTLVYALLAACTHRGDIGAFIDPQASLFAPAAEAAGIDLERLIVVRPGHAQALRRALDALVRSGACAVVVVDAAGAEALQTHHCARLVAQAERTATTLIALSQGDSQALASFASLRLRMHGLAPLWQDGSDGGARLSGYGISLDIAKSRMGAPGKSATVEVCIPDVSNSWPVPVAGPDDRGSQELEDDDRYATIA